MKSIFLLLIPFVIFANRSFCQENDKRFDHQVVPSLTIGSSSHKGLEYKLADVYGLKYTVRKRETRVRLSLGLAMSNYRTKSEKKYISFNPQSDTFDIFHWNHVLYEFEVLMDFILRENEKNKLYISLGWNIGGYLESRKITKRYDDSQNDKLILVESKELGQPTESLLVGRGLGVGYERMINDLWSFSVVPNIKYKVGMDVVNPDIFDVFTPDVFLFGGLSVGLRLNL